MSELLKVALVSVNQPGYHSLGLGYVRAMAEADEKLQGKVAFQTMEFDIDLDPWWIAYRVIGIDPDVVGFSVACWSGRHVYEACRIIARARPKIKIVLGGPEVGPIAEEVLRAHPEVFAVVRGEGEATFAELLHIVRTGKRAWMVAGVTARDREEIVSAPDRPAIEDLDTIPSPYLTGVMTPVDGATFVESYRGCPFTCGYCFEAKGERRIRKFSRERVEAEVALIAGAPGMTNFSFIDSVFNLTPDRLEWLAGVLAPYAARGVRLHTIEVNIDKVDDRQAELLKTCGVASVETGPQTVGERALEVCRRDFDPETFRRGVEALNRVGISVECDLIVGLPGDDIYDFLAGLRFAFSLDPGRVQTSTLHVLPGTDFWIRADELGLQFDPEPPHETIATRDADFADLRRAEILSMSLQDIYRAKV